MQAQAPADSSRPAELPISAQLASLAGADATAPCGARLRGRSAERGALQLGQHTTDTHSSQTTTVRSSYIHNTTCAHRYRYTLCTLRQLHPNPAQAIDGGDQRTKDRRWMAAPGCLHRCQRSRDPLGLPRTLRRLKSNESQTYIAPRRQSAAVVDPGPFKPTSLVQDRITSIP